MDGEGKGEEAERWCEQGDWPRGGDGGSPCGVKGGVPGGEEQPEGGNVEALRRLRAKRALLALAEPLWAEHFEVCSGSAD